MARRSKTPLLPGYRRPASAASVGVREAQRGAGPTPPATDRTSIIGAKTPFEKTAECQAARGSLSDRQIGPHGLETGEAVAALEHPELDEKDAGNNLVL